MSRRERDLRSGFLLALVAGALGAAWAALRAAGAPETVVGMVGVIGASTAATTAVFVALRAAAEAGRRARAASPAPGTSAAEQVEAWVERQVKEAPGSLRRLAATAARRGPPWATLCVGATLASCYAVELVVAPELGSRGWISVGAAMRLGAWDGWGMSDPLPRAFAATTLHASWRHLADNLVSLFLFGPVAELLAGPSTLLASYGLAGLCSLAWSSSDGLPELGASGSIYGLAGLVIAETLVKRRAPIWRRAVGVWALAQCSGIIPGHLDGWGVWVPHLCGLLGGLGSGVALRRSGEGRRGALAAALAGATIASVALMDGRATASRWLASETAGSTTDGGTGDRTWDQGSQPRRK